MTLNEVYNLFAYCDNNSVMFCDYSGYKWITKLSEYNKRWYSSKKIYKRIKENYNKNKKLFKNYYKLAIYGQGTSPVKSMRYGDYNISYNGCELVAVYNVMRFINKKQNFAQIILEFEINHMYYFFNSGKYGTDPEDLKKYFRAHNVDFGYATRLDMFIKNIISKKNKCGIFSFWNNECKEHPFDFVSGGLHTVAYDYDAKTKKITTFNLYNSDTKVRYFTINQLKNYILKHYFIIGYWF